MVHLMPAPLQNKKEVLFGNMPEIYHFHRRWRSAICPSLMILTYLCWRHWCSSASGGETWRSASKWLVFFILSLSLRHLHSFIINMILLFSQDLSEGVGAVHRLPRVGWKVFSTEGEWIIRVSECKYGSIWFLECKWFSLSSSRWLIYRSMRSTVTTSLAQKAFGGSAQTVPSFR